jgi:23S rRNA (guanosine2251-2'-O)-methyltransferase
MYIYGKNVAKEKLQSNDKINKAYVSKKFKDNEILDQLFKRNIRVNFVDNKVLDSKVDGLHQGIILDIDEFKTYELNEFLDDLKTNNKYHTLVMLDHLEDPHNFGAIIRTSEALGVEGIIIPNDRSVSITSTVVKTSAGAIENIKIIKVPNLTATISKLKEKNYWIVGTDMKGQNYREIDYNMNVCLVIGNEGKGMSKIVRDNCDFIASIPMTGKINSLNASVSCGIILSQIVSGRK